ncbi:specific transcriptional repressor [Coprinopsis cinerea AmutBmut pab1-1]|nr:specific transcriptional repressor [Coprinopsis cinerea AmutBmut pab1-1]
MHGSPSASTTRGTPSRRGKSPRFSSDSLSQPGSSTGNTGITNKPPTTFISSLDIPVEGAIPIETDSDDKSTTDKPSTAAANDSKRAPRKSKTEAIAALNSQARSSAEENEETEQLEDLADRYRNMPPIQVSPHLDLSTVKTPSSSRRAKPATDAHRPFGLQNCPEFHPTTEEFKDPMAYIRSISDRAKDYGICKIIPPEGWRMPFVTDTKTFRFKTRLQRLNSIEASSRAKLNFLEQLYRFHKQQGNPRVVVPTINHKPLDLWLLRKEVHKMGGYEAVTKGKKWSDLGRTLGYRGIPGLSTQLKNSYTRVILPFEHYTERARNSPTMASNANREPPLRIHLNLASIAKAVKGPSPPSTEGTSPPGSPLTATSSPLSEPPEESGDKDKGGASRPRRSTRMSSVEQSPRKAVPAVPPPVFYDKQGPRDASGEHCEICHKRNRGEEMLLCDGCDCGFHIFCLDPPLTFIPKEQWFCFTCLSGTGGDFGFDEGAEHSLSTFQARDLEFRKLWFETHPPPGSTNRMVDDEDPTISHFGNVAVSEYDVEEEFWRLVASPHETVEIEYGADVHSTTHGSAMPTMETHPLDPASKDPWNLNNIPILPDSLLRFIKSDISGMTVPWTYVGMAFSTFCWHNEDHYTYSINYMHWGETKTWYGIPGDDAEKFEAAIMSEAPDLFENQPDLLFQLVTLMNPQRLTEAGVRVFACNQRAGEFVITFPKAYHAGFNHGLNFNEAVNFALPDWLPLGRDCVQRYREHRKLPVFSHDELLITITQQSQSIKTAIWLVDCLREMTEREFEDRKKVRALGLAEILKEEDHPEEQYQCHVCKAFCYLSQVVCQCTTRVVCADHVELLCEAKSPHNMTLRKRFSDEELTETLARVSERASQPTAWRSKLARLLTENARPPLRSLRALLAEGDRINYPLPEMPNLRKCVTRANEWVDFANSFIIRKQSRKRSRRGRGRPSTADLGPFNPEDPNDRPDRGLDELYAHLREVENLGFDCPEINTLKTLAQQAEDTKAKAIALLKASPAEQERSEFLQECKRLLLEGSSLNVLLDELNEVEKIVDREQLVNELDEKLEEGDENSLTLEEVRQLLTRARSCGLPSDNKHMQFLEARLREGNTWEERARAVLEQPIKTIAELEEFADMDSNIPIDPTIIDRLMAARAKALDFKKQAKAWLACADADGPKSRISEALRLAARSEKDFSIPEVTELKKAAEWALDLESKSESVLRNRYQLDMDEDLFATIKKWQSHAVNHLRMYSLPTFEKLTEQVRLHELWLRDLPWFCPDHNTTHSEELLADVLDCTRPEDDAPPTDEYYTCICNHPVRPPPPGVVSDAVQCDHCFARFHGECAKNGGSCPFCDHHHWNGTIHKQRSWHFCYLPMLARKAPEISKHYSRDFRELELIVHRVDRLSASIGQFLSYTSQPAHQRPEFIPQVRHYMRKLFRIQFAVSPNPDISYGLDLAGLHRILATRPAVARPKKRRRPRFTFGQDVDKNWSDGTRCICRGVTGYLLNKPKVECLQCQRLYHVGCVFFPVDDHPPTMQPVFQCPICCLRRGKRYEYSDVRVRPSVHMGRVEDDLYVNTEEMLETFSRELIFKKLSQPVGRTLFVELVNYQPGSDTLAPPPGPVASGSRTSIMQQHNMAPPLPPPPPPPPPHHTTTGHHEQILHLSTVTPTMYAPSPLQPPPPPPNQITPPPWSRWGTMTTPSMPPQTQRRANNGDRSRGGTPQPSSSRKRKHVDGDDNTRSRSSSSASGANKRRATQGSSPSGANGTMAAVPPTGPIPIAASGPAPAVVATGPSQAAPPPLAAEDPVPYPPPSSSSSSMPPPPSVTKPSPSAGPSRLPWNPLSNGSSPPLQSSPPVKIATPPGTAGPSRVWNPMLANGGSPSVAASNPPGKLPSQSPSTSTLALPKSPVSPPNRPAQTLSPSLAMIVSPTNEAPQPQTSPRVAYIPPAVRNGMTNGSPTLPPVNTLVSGDAASR